MVNEVTKNGMTDCGEILAEAENGKIITDSTEWWMFSESVIGLYNAYQITGDKAYLERSEKVWEFTKQYVINHDTGEWFWGVDNKTHEPLGK